MTIIFTDRALLPIIIFFCYRESLYNLSVFKFYIILEGLVKISLLRRYCEIRDDNVNKL